MKKEIVLAVVLGCAAVSYCDVLVAWDVGSSRPGTIPAGWTTWDNSMTNGVASTVNGITIQTSTTSSNAANVAQITGGGTDASFRYIAAPLMTLVVADEMVYEDYLSTAVASSKDFTISGLDAGKEYQIQLVGSFMHAGNNISITKDGVLLGNLIPDGDSTANLVVFSDYISVTGTDTVTFTFDRSVAGGGNANQLGISGVIVNVIPEPATLGLFAISGVVLLALRRKIRFAAE